MADTAASVLAKLKNKAKASGISYQQCLQLFMQEEFLRRLSKSAYRDNLVLKGGLFIYTLTNKGVVHLTVETASNVLLHLSKRKIYKRDGNIF